MADVSSGVADFGTNPGIKRPDANPEMAQPQTPFQRGLSAGIPALRAKAKRLADPRFVYRVDETGARDLMMAALLADLASILTVPGVGLVTKFLLWGKLSSYNVSFFEMYRGTKKNAKRLSAKAQKELDTKVDELSKKERDDKGLWERIFDANFNGFLTSLVIENIPVIDWLPANALNMSAIINETRTNDRLEQRLEHWSGWFEKRDREEKAEQSWRASIAAGIMGAKDKDDIGWRARLAEGMLNYKKGDVIDLRGPKKRTERYLGKASDYSPEQLEKLLSWRSHSESDARGNRSVSGYFKNQDAIDEYAREQRKTDYDDFDYNEVDGVRSEFDKGKLQGLPAEGIEGEGEDYAGFVGGKPKTDIDGINRDMYELVDVEPAEALRQSDMFAEHERHLMDVPNLGSRHAISEQAKEMMRQKRTGAVAGEAGINPDVKKAMQDMRLIQGVAAPQSGDTGRDAMRTIRTGDLLTGRQIPVYGADATKDTMRRQVANITSDLGTTSLTDIPADAVGRTGQGIRATEARKALGDWLKSSPGKLDIIVNETFDAVPPETWSTLLADRTAARSKLDALTIQAIERMDTESNLHLQSTMQDLVDDVGTRLRGREFRSLIAMKDAMSGAIEDAINNQ